MRPIRPAARLNAIRRQLRLLRRRPARVAFVGCLLLAFIVRWTAAMAFPNMLWPDEFWQSLEQGHRLVFGHGLVPWEFIEGIRSWIFPAALGALMWVTAGLGSGSLGYLAATSGALCLLACVPVYVAFRWSRRRGATLVAASVAALVPATWFELVYFAPKAFNEVVAAHLFPLAVLVGSFGRAPRSRRLFGAGLIFGVIAGLRIHLGPALGVCALWLAGRRLREGWLPLCAGTGLALAAFGIVDWVSWSSPWQSIWRNVWINVIEGKSHGWGTEPWTFYLERFGDIWGAGLIPLALLVALGIRRAPLAFVAALTVVVTHSFLAHKEYRFVYPAVTLLVFVASQGAAALLGWLRSVRSCSWRLQLPAALALVLVWTTTSTLLALRFDSHATRNTFPAPRESHWTRFSGHLRAFALLSQQRDLCGLGLFRVHPYSIPGYSVLHQRVPFVTMDSPRDLARRGSYANYLIGGSASAPGGYRSVRCWREVCVFKRDGRCVRVPGWPNERFWFFNG